MNVEATITVPSVIGWKKINDEPVTFVSVTVVVALPLKANVPDRGLMRVGSAVKLRAGSIAVVLVYVSLPYWTWPPVGPA